MDPQMAFQVLQPASIAVAQNQNVESVQALCRAVEQIVASEKHTLQENSTSCISDLKEYLIFPLFIILKSEKKCSETLLEEIVRCMHMVLRQSAVDDFNFFKEIFAQIFILLTDKENPQKGSSLSEDCKQLSLITVTSLIHNSSAAVRDQIYCHGFRPQLGHAVFVCLKLAQGEKNRTLRVEAVECLLAMGQRKMFNSLSAKQTSMLSDTFSNFLPGIVIGLAKIASGDEKQGHKITSIAIEAWSYFVTLVMRDEYLEEKVMGLQESETVTQLRMKLFKQEDLNKITKAVPSKTKTSKFYLPEPDEEPVASKLPNVEISRKWVTETSEKLLVLLQSITKLVSHSHWKVRHSLIMLSEQLICTCHKSLSGALLLAVQVIITLRSDDVLDVGSAAQDSLLAVMNVIGFDDQHSQSQKGLHELLEEHVFALITQLPTVFRQQDDTKTLTSVRQLVGCLEVLGERIVQLMTWPSHSLRLLRSLCFGLTLDAADSDLLLERTSAEDPFSILNIKPSLGRSFKFFQDMRIFQAVAASCKLIGYHGNVTVVSDLCLELLQETLVRKEVLLLFTLVVQGRDRRKFKEKDRCSIATEESERVVQNILDVIMNLEVLDVPLCVATGAASDNEECFNSSKALIPVNKQQNISVDLVKSNVVLVANALNLISATAQMIGNDFKMFLSSILCSVMEKAGDTNVLVGYTGRNTLAEIAEACEYESVAKLIENGVPHYWYLLSLKLKRLHQYPTAPLVLQVCLEYANIDVIAFTEELVQEVLVCLDTYHSEQALPLLRVLLVYVMAVIRYEANAHVFKKRESLDCVKIVGETATLDNRSDNKKENLVSFLREYHNNQSVVKQGLDKNDSTVDQALEEDISCTRLKDEPQQSDWSETLAVNDENVYEDESKPDENKKEVPVYITHVVEILEKSSHLLYYQDRKIKLLILEIIKAGAEALSYWENERLPVFHKLWKPLVLRLKDSDFVVLMHSFEALTVMAVSSGDFLRRRVLKEIFPAMYLFLRNQSAVSLQKIKRSGYYMTAAYRAQCILLKNLPDLIKVLSLGVLDIGELLDVLILYLDTRQPQQLLNYSLTILKLLAISHPQHVWLALAYQQSSMRIVPLVADLSPIKFRSKAAGYLPSEAVALYNQLL